MRRAIYGRVNHPPHRDVERPQRVAELAERLKSAMANERIARQLGFSGRDLGKLCARCEIPVRHGWWAKKQHGHVVRRIPLPPWDDSARDTVFQPSEVAPQLDKPHEVQREKDSELADSPFSTGFLSTRSVNSFTLRTPPNEIVA